MTAKSSTKNWDKVASDSAIAKAVEALSLNGIEAMVVANGKEAHEKVLELVPEGAEVMTMTSVTLDSIGIPEVLDGSGKYDSVKKKLMSTNRETEALQMQRLGAAPEYAVGSVHAVTEDGKVVVVSNTGSQLPAYAYGSMHVIWVVGGQKIVKDLDAAMERVYEHVLPLESERARIAYGVEGSNVSKLLTVTREVNPNRIKMIIVKEPLGF